MATSLPTSFEDHVRRLEALLASTRRDYETFATLTLEGTAQITLRSYKRSVTLALRGTSIGTINMEIEDLFYHRVRALEKELQEVRQQALNTAAQPPGTNDAPAPVTAQPTT